MFKRREPVLLDALIPVIFLIISLSLTIIRYGGSPHVPIIFSTIVAGVIAVKNGITWKELEEGIVHTIKISMPATLILIIIGTVIGSWMLAGIVPTMICYGLAILTPSIFLVATCLICALVSTATGSSWTTAGTIGIALCGVGQGLGVPLPITAGAIISGAYFGDKMSPLSDTTNLAPAMAGTTLFEHVRHMIYTTGPSMVIALIIYGIIGLRYGEQSVDLEQTRTIIQALHSQFTISPLLLIPPLIVIVIVIKKVPAIPGLMAGTLLGVLFALIFQKNCDWGTVMQVLQSGYKSRSGIVAIDSLLSRGGIDSMMSTVSLILCAMSFGGVMEKAGLLQCIAQRLLRLAKSTGSLVLITNLSCIFMNFTAGDQYISIVVPGRMYRDAFRRRGLHPKNLSRCLEDSGTLSSPLIPWNTCGAFMFSVLQVHPFAYLPFAFLNLINPLISVFYGYTGITMVKLPPEDQLQSESRA